MNPPASPAASIDPAVFEQARQSFVQGVDHFEAGRFEQALLAFEASLARLPDRASTLANLGATWLRLGEPERALPLLARALVIEPGDIDAWIEQGLALAALDRPSEALASFEQVLQRDAGHLPAAYQRCLMLVSLKRYSDALAATDALLARDSRSESTLWVRADLLHRLNRFDDALAAYAQLLAINPRLHRAWSQRGGILKDMGRHAEAIAAFRQALALGGDAELNGYFLAALLEATQHVAPPTGASHASGATAMPSSAPRHYVEALFDDYAEQFDEHLVGQLGYQAHRVLVEQLLALPHASGGGFASALDLGCGTGLCGPLLQGHVKRLTGIDLSAQMLARARATGAYQELAQADIQDYLGAATGPHHDLVLSADVFIYVGALEAVFGGVNRVLQPGGIFCFSVEKAEDAVGVKLTRGLRYAHARHYLLDLAGQHGLDLVKVVEHPIRQDQGINIDGLFVYLSKR